MNVCNCVNVIKVINSHVAYFHLFSVFLHFKHSADVNIYLPSSNLALHLSLITITKKEKRDDGSDPEWSPMEEKKIKSWGERLRGICNSESVCDWFSFHIPHHTLFSQYQRHKNVNEVLFKDFKANETEFNFHAQTADSTVPDCHRTKPAFAA